MSIHKTPDGTWRVKYQDRERRQRSRTFKELPDAEAFDQTIKKMKDEARKLDAMKAARKQVLGV